MSELDKAGKRIDELNEYLDAKEKTVEKLRNIIGEIGLITVERHANNEDQLQRIWEICLTVAKDDGDE